MLSIGILSKYIGYLADYTCLLPLIFKKVKYYFRQFSLKIRFHLLGSFPDTFYKTQRCYGKYYHSKFWHFRQKLAIRLQTMTPIYLLPNENNVNSYEKLHLQLLLSATLLFKKINVLFCF